MHQIYGSRPNALASSEPMDTITWSQLQDCVSKPSFCQFKTILVSYRLSSKRRNKGLVLSEHAFILAVYHIDIHQAFAHAFTEIVDEYVSFITHIRRHAGLLYCKYMATCRTVYETSCR